MAPPRVIVVGGGCTQSPTFSPQPPNPLICLLTCHCSSVVSGLSAAHTVYLNGGNVLVLDKQGQSTMVSFFALQEDANSEIDLGFFGGNSTKATSGINGALTRTQVDLGIGDSVKQFYEDTLKSARDKARPDLIKVLTYKSASAVEWLQDVFNLDLTLVSRLGWVDSLFLRWNLEETG
jgi:FAD binding domain-containing protein